MTQEEQIRQTLKRYTDVQLREMWWSYGRFLVRVYSPRLKAIEAEMRDRGIDIPGDSLG